MTDINLQLAVEPENPAAAKLRGLHAIVQEKASRGGRDDHGFMADVVRQVASFRETLPDLQVEVLLEVARYFYTRAQDAHRGLEAAAIAVGVARRAGLKPQLRKALSFLGVLSMSVQNVRGAIEANTEALELAVELGDRPAQCAVSNNIGGVLLDTFYFDDAIQLFRFGITTASGSANARKIEASCLSNLALCYLHKDDVMRGIEAIRASINLYGEPGNADERVRRVIAEFVYTRLLCAQKRTKDARTRASLARAYAAQADSTRADLYAEFAEALCDAFEGNRDLAETRLTVALEKSKVITSAGRDALATIIQVCRQLDESDRAEYYRGELRALVLESQKSAALDLEILQTRGMKQRGQDGSPLKVVAPHPYNEARERVLRAMGRAS